MGKHFRFPGGLSQLPMIPDWFTPEKQPIEKYSQLAKISEASSEEKVTF